MSSFKAAEGEAFRMPGQTTLPLAPDLFSQQIIALLDYQMQNPLNHRSHPEG